MTYTQIPNERQSRRRYRWLVEDIASGRWNWGAGWLTFVPGKGMEWKRVSGTAATEIEARTRRENAITRALADFR